MQSTMRSIMPVKILTVILALLALTYIQAYADGTTATINIGAQVADCLDFTWNMHRLLGDEDPLAGDPDQYAMDFQNISELDPATYPGRMFTDIWYALFLWVTADEPYHIKQTTQSLMTQDGQYNLDKHFVVIPAYSADDAWDGQYPQGAIGNDALGPASLVKNADILYYGNEGKSRIVRLYYSIPAEPKVNVPGWEPIPTSQFSGDYHSTVTITITPQAP